MKKKLLAFLLAAAMLFSLCACGGGGNSTQTQAPATPAPATQQPENNPPDDTPATEPGTEDPGADTSTEPEPTFEPLTGEAGKYTYSVYSTLAADWNPHTYQDTTASDTLSYLRSALYAWIFNDELHPVEGKDPFTTYTYLPEMAVGDPIDVTLQVKAEHPEWFPEDAESGYAWAVNLREDMTFDNGHKINAETFVESAKRLLNPEMKNYRAPDFYNGQYGIVGAEAYALGLAGQYKTYDNGNIGKTLKDMTKDENGQYVTTEEGWPAFIAINSTLAWCNGETLKTYVDKYGTDYFGLDHWDELVAMMDNAGLIPCTDENLALLATVTTTNPNWGETEDDLPNYLVLGYEKYKDEITYDDVGFFASGDYQITYVYKTPLKAGFQLQYYGLSNFFLVDPEVYDACLTQDDAGVWHSTYMTSAETSPSYGPYSMVSYQADKSQAYTRNESWWGYTDGNHKYIDPVDGETYDFYQTTDVEMQVVKEYATQRQMFLSGEFISYGLKSDDYAQYRNSEYCYASPGSTVFFFVVNGNLEQIQAREAAADFDQATQDLETMTLKSFRQALGLTFDKDAFCAAISPSRTPGYGIFANEYIYDPETGAKYRDTDQAKQVLCDFYSVDVSQFASLDDAVASITGYDPVTAKEYYTQAFNDAIEAGYITDTNNDGISDQTLTLYYSTDSEGEMLTRMRDYFNEMIVDVLKDTPWYDPATNTAKVKFDISPILDDWVEPLRNGEYDYALAGWNGSLLDPFNLTDVYVNPDYSYDAKWFNPQSVNLTINVNGQDLTMNLKDWSDALNGTSVNIGGTYYNFSANNADVDTRLDILAALEGAFLQTYDYLPFMTDGSMSLLSQKVFYVTEEYNSVLGRGGITYMKYNYDDAEWADYVNEQVALHGQLQY